MMTERQRNAQIEYRIQALAEANGLDGPEAIYLAYDDLQTAAEAVLNAEVRGESQTYPMVVVLFAWGYGAISARDGYEGCPHDVMAATERWAGIEAIRDHERRCMGR